MFKNVAMIMTTTLDIYMTMKCMPTITIQYDEPDHYHDHDIYDQSDEYDNGVGVGVR
jgi:hypothetical protein